MNKKVVSICCDSSVQHFPTNGLNSMNKTIFFCDKCGKTCETKIVVEEDKKK